MPLPQSLRVKISTEDAGAISVTPVIVQELRTAELLDRMLSLTGKDPGRIREILLRGTLVSGASRLRWVGFEAALADIAAELDAFPDPEPARPFAPERCVRAVIKTAAGRIEVPREAGSETRLFRKQSFWDVLMGIAGDGGPSYVDYSYREHADCFQLQLSADAAAALRESAGLIRYTRLEAQVRAARIEGIELFVARR